jgi:hypothetical protein
MTMDMTMLTDTLSGTNDQGYDKANRYFISHNWAGIWLGYPILYLSQIGRDINMLTNTLSVTNDQGYD